LPPWPSILPSPPRNNLSLSILLFVSFQVFNGRICKAIQPIQTLDLFLISTLTHADSLPNLEIDSTYSVGLDKIDLRKCREKGIWVHLRSSLSTHLIDALKDFLFQFKR
jgi:hypothetical protein